MKHTLYTLLATAMIGSATLFYPQHANAFTATLVSITPDATDISDQVSGAPEGVSMFAWMTTIDTEYTATFTVDEQPAMLVTPGGSITLDQPPTYDAATSTSVVTFNATGVKGSQGQGEDFPDGQGMSIIGMVGAADEGEDGPPAEMRGGWMSTNIQQWEIIPPSPDNVAFGFNLTGPAGETGFFHMFIPDTLIDLLSEYSGKELTAENLAVFNGDEQASLAVTDVAGGVYIDINVVFAEATTTVTADSDTVEKSITVAEQQPVSLAASKTTVSAGKTVKLYGWLANGKTGQTVTLWRKLKNQDSYTKWKTLTTKSDGYFHFRFGPKNTANYKAKYDNTGTTITSAVEMVTVN